MRLDEMLADVEVIRSTLPPGVSPGRVICDSREVRAGDLFVAIRGEKSDGLGFLGEVVGARAAAVVVGPGRYDEALRRLSTLDTPPGGVPGVLEVVDERRALAILARNAEGRPDLELDVIGITGTNGKTTTAWLLAAIFQAAGLPCGLMGTVEYRFGELRKDASRTTPEGPEIHHWLRRMVDAGAVACAMEVSSHALDMKRVAGLRFSAALFTNLTRDHLDYHLNMDGYYAAKRRLFQDLDPGVPAVINIDDPWGRKLAGETGGEVVLYGEGEEAAVRVVECRTDMDGTSLIVEERGSRHEIRSALVGRHNALNITAAVAAARSLRVSWEAVRTGLAAVGRIPGRLERVDAGQPFTVVIDYAHTDDALRSVLEVLRPLTRGRLITVFGCGGDRDVIKRPLMGARVASLSDLFWVTSDNPRGEDPVAIIEMVLEGVRRHEGGMDRCRVEADRARAIEAAVAEAREGDTVLIAGKGHERRQVTGARSLPFDDVDVARRAVEVRLRAERKDEGGEPS